MTKIISHNYTGKSLVVVYSDATGVHNKIVQDSHLNWKAIMALYKKAKYAEMIPLLDVNNAITSQSKGKFTVKNGKVFYNGDEVNGYLFEQIVFFLKEFPQQYPRLVKFAENLYLNPSERARNELYQFLKQGDMPITDDGCFLAYKGVDREFWSKSAGILKPIKGKIKGTEGNYYIYNGVGEQIEVDRDKVDPDSSNHCSVGLHVGSFRYADGFKGDGHLVIVKVNPKDACSVPSDDAGKLRCCAYEVIAEEGKKLSNRRDGNFDKAAKVRYHNKRGSDGKFIARR